MMPIDIPDQASKNRDHLVTISRVELYYYTLIISLLFEYDALRKDQVQDRDRVGRKIMRALDEFEGVME